MYIIQLPMHESPTALGDIAYDAARSEASSFWGGHQPFHDLRAGELQWKLRILSTLNPLDVAEHRHEDMVKYDEVWAVLLRFHEFDCFSSKQRGHLESFKESFKGSYKESFEYVPSGKLT